MGPALQRAPIGNPVYYERRRPEETTLYRLVQEHIESFLAQVEAESGVALPEFVKAEFDAFLACGILAHGFLRLRCSECAHEKLVAFSCKRRGFCPSCGARRMAETAAHLVDRVIPPVPVRQWVLSFPIPLRILFAAQPQLLAAIAGDPPGHCQLSNQAGGTETSRRQHRRGHTHPALRLSRQFEYSSALSDA
jgi:hypothetical protein